MNKLAVVLCCFTLVFVVHALEVLQIAPKATIKGDIYGCVTWTNLGYCTVPSLEDFMRENCLAACGYCKALPPAPPDNHIVPVDISSCRSAHNKYRALHGVVALEWDDAMANASATWALHLATINKLEHDSSSSDGENAYYGVGSVKTCAEAVKLWYSEINNYDFDNPGFDYTTGHFTQVVWKSSTKLGVGKATRTYGGVTKTFIVARYSPAGNSGQYAYNVPRLI